MLRRDPNSILSHHNVAVEGLPVLRCSPTKPGVDSCSHNVHLCNGSWKYGMAQLRQ